MPGRMRASRRPTTRGGRTAAGKYRRMGVGFSGLRRRGRMYPLSTPTFTETYSPPDSVIAGIVGGAIQGNRGGVMSVRISDIPQINDYATLYRQYRINWVKVMLVPNIAGTGVDINTVFQNNALGYAAAGPARIAFVKNTTPAVTPPVVEGDVLEDNGCKIRPLVNMWSSSFKPVTDKYTGDAAGGAGVAVREKFRGFLSFADLPGNNPLHYGISYWISHYTPGAAFTNWKVYVKVNFSLRDPQ